jgi:hypothetical protein
VYENTNHSEHEKLIKSRVNSANEKEYNNPGANQKPLAETKTCKTVELNRKSQRGKISKKQRGIFAGDKMDCPRIIYTATTAFQYLKFIYYEPKNNQRTMESS